MKVLILTLTLLSFSGFVNAEETLSEKAEATANDVARGVKKGANRVKESLCAKGDAKCLAQKAKHRGEEAADYTADKAKELKNTVDSDKK